MAASSHPPEWMRDLLGLFAPQPSAGPSKVVHDAWAPTKPLNTQQVVPTSPTASNRTASSGSEETGPGASSDPSPLASPTADERLSPEPDLLSSEPTSSRDSPVDAEQQPLAEELHAAKDQADQDEADHDEAGPLGAAGSPTVPTTPKRSPTPISSARFFAQKASNAIQAKQKAISSIVSKKMHSDSPTSWKASKGGDKTPVKKWPTVTAASSSTGRVDSSLTRVLQNDATTVRVMARYDTVTSTLHGLGHEIVKAQPVYVYQGITPREDEQLEA